MSLFDYFRRPMTFSDYFRDANTSDLDHFLRGYTIFPDQGSIEAARWKGDTDQLIITDRSGLTHVYDEVPAWMAGDFFNTHDKDSWLQNNYRATYRDVIGGRPQTVNDAPVQVEGWLMDEFLNSNVRLHFTSSFGPVEAQYDKSLEALECKFVDGFVGTYAPFPKAQAESLAASVSKGKWWHRNAKLGYNPNRTWIHAYPYHPNVTLEQYRGKYR